jgi:aminoglycoside phosphotransferase (APT) family kinase protein
MLEPAALESYLRERMGGAVRVVGMKRSPMGLSRETWFITLQDRKVTLRCDLAGGSSSVPTTLAKEFEIQRLLGATALPMARVLWMETEPAALGFPFYLREYVEGVPAVEHFEDPAPQWDDVRIAVSKEHVRKMAQVHQLDWKALGFADLLAAPAAPQESATVAIDRIAAAIDEIALEPLPALVDIIAWLRETAPSRPTQHVGLCKGSNGDMQEVWRDGEIVALSDWELASIGDPASDWGRCQGYAPTISGRWDMRRLLDYYEEVCGVRIEVETVVYYRLIYRLEMLLVGYYSARPVVSGALPDARLAMLGSLANLTGEANLVRAWMEATR